ncbi:intraflagellar transport protein 88 homolog isoform X2 [Centruroides vittatus]|uniref:intraflagellar transport protein 88 homolog isoform X2 n=1 Tax=Centruroides vittatus TaxID=120091 RepID=UPI0035100EA0
MENNHSEKDDDLYSGYNDYDRLTKNEYERSLLNTTTLRIEPSSEATPIINYKTFSSNKNTGIRPMTPDQMVSSVVNMGKYPSPEPTTNLSKPMTPRTAAGYRSTPFRNKAMLSQLKLGKSDFSAVKDEQSPRKYIKQLEKEIEKLIEESCAVSAEGDLKTALDKAKEAATKDQGLDRYREQLVVNVSKDMVLTQCVLSNLANQYMLNENYPDALKTYRLLIRTVPSPTSTYLRVNIGNIYYKQKNYPKAIKSYRMVLDQVPTIYQSLKIKIMRNIGLAFVQMGLFAEAITSYAYIMNEKPDFKTCLNLLLCYYSLRDQNGMKYCFQQLINIELGYMSHENNCTSNMEIGENHCFVTEAIRNDTLAKLEQKKKHEAESIILIASKLIAPVITSNFSTGYEWCIEQLKLSVFSELAKDLEVNKAVMYLEKRKFTQAVETLKSLVNDPRILETVTTNLSFIYFLQGDIKNAEYYADEAVRANHYNSGALVNKGNCLLAKEDYNEAIRFYTAAFIRDASCLEALYNLGLTYKKSGRFSDALVCFNKFHATLQIHPQVLYHIGEIYELIGNFDNAIKWYEKCLSLVPSEPQLLSRIGFLYDAEGDRQQALHHYEQAYRYFPSNVDILGWLGVYYVDIQIYEKAIEYFREASRIESNNSKWLLLMASCHRRNGNYNEALEIYRDAHEKFPQNIESLRFLARISSDLGLEEADEYVTKLRKIENWKYEDMKMYEQFQQKLTFINDANQLTNYNASVTSKKCNAISFDDIEVNDLLPD